MIPVHNRPTLIGDAVESVLDQRGVDLEVVVVDDGSTDDTAAAVDALAESHAEVSVVHQANKGPSAARNTGVEACRAELVTFLDSDDLMLPERLVTQYRVLVEQGLDGVFARARNHLAPGNEAPELISLMPPSQRDVVWYICSMLVERAAFESVGGFDAELRHAEDTDLYARLTRTGFRISRLDQVLSIRRLFGDNISYAIDPGRTALDLVRRHRPR